MTKPKQAFQTDRGRFYRSGLYPDQKFISVTTALKVLDKPALVPWAAKMVAEEVIGQLPYWVRKVRSVGVAAAVNEAKGSPYAKRDAAADLGSEIHAAAEAHLLGKPYTVPDAVRPFLDQYLRFLDEHKVDPEASEATVANPEFGYAGTGDLWAKLHGEPGVWLIDLKTSSTRPVDSVYPEYAYQLAALRQAPKLWLDDKTELDAPVVVRCAVLNVRADDYRLIPISEKAIDACWAVFCACVDIATLTAELKDSTFDEPVTVPALTEVA